MAALAILTRFGDRSQRESEPVAMFVRDRYLRSQDAGRKRVESPLHSCHERARKWNGCDAIRSDKR